MIRVDVMGTTSIYTDGDLLKGRTPEIHIQISRHVRKDGNRLSCYLRNYHAWLLGRKNPVRRCPRKKGLGGTRDSEFSVGRGGFSNWENKHLICHRMSVPHRRFGKTAQLPHPVSLLASAHAAVRTACFTSRGVCAVSSNAEAGHTCSKDSREDLGLHRYLHQTQAVKGGFRLNRWKLDEVNRKKDLGGYLAATGSI